MKESKGESKEESKENRTEYMMDSLIIKNRDAGNAQLITR